MIEILTDGMQGSEASQVEPHAPKILPGLRGKGRRRPRKDPLKKYLDRLPYFVIGTAAVAGLLTGISWSFVLSTFPTQVSRADRLAVGATLAQSLINATYPLAGVSVVAALTMVLLTSQSIAPELLILRVKDRTLSTQFFVSVFPLVMATFAISFAIVGQTTLASPYTDTPTHSISRLTLLDVSLWFLLFWQGLYLMVLVLVGQIALYSKTTRLAKAGARDFESDPPFGK